MRVFAAPSETFVYTQITQIRRYRGVMLTRELRNPEHFPHVNVVAYLGSSGARKRMSDLLYRSLRVLSPPELRFYLESANRLEPALFHVHYAVDAAYFAPLISRYRVPTVVSCYGYDVSSFRRQYLGLGGRYLQRAWSSADLYLAMSTDMREDMIRAGCPPDRIRIHYHGINLERFPCAERGPRADALRILFVGRMDEKKGIEYALRGFGLVANEIPQAEFRIVGEGELGARYEGIARDLGLAARVSFAGFVAHDQVASELAAADVFCHPSITAASGDKEGIPGTIVEAMATGLPIVTTRHAGIPEMVRDGEHGFVVRERDAPAIAQALRRLIQDPDLRLRMGKAAAARARELGDAARQTAALEAIYDDARRK